MHHFFEPGIINGNLYLSEEESWHALKVLRLNLGDPILVLDGQGSKYFCKIATTSKLCGFEVVEKIQIPKTRPFVHIAIAPTKNQDRMEWFVEKATEIGIDAITFIQTKNTEKAKLRMDRLMKKSIGAMKQSMNLWLPSLAEEKDFRKFLDKQTGKPNQFIAYVDEQPRKHLKDAAKVGEPALVLIGPEGDFTQAEIQMAFQEGFEAVSLGENRLRTETAGLVACHTLIIANS